MNTQDERKAFLECWYENNLPYDGDAKVREECFEYWQAAKAHEAKKLEGCVVVPRGVLDLTRFMCKTWSEIDKFVYKNCRDIAQYPVIQGTQNQLNLSRIGDQQINANEINKGVKWLLEAARGGNE